MVQDLNVIAENTRYPLEAFLFVQRGLDETVRKIHGEPDDTKPPESRHVAGEDLCFGLRDFALSEYGLMARTVLARWNINNCEDFGLIVFAMVDCGLMQKTEDDRVEDFCHLFEFSDAFSCELSLTD